jgi:hypothetical protein
MQSFKSWAEAENQELETIRNTSAKERMEILHDLILLQNELPKQRSNKAEEQIPVIYRTKAE